MQVFTAKLSTLIQAASTIWLNGVQVAYYNMEGDSDYDGESVAVEAPAENTYYLKDVDVMVDEEGEAFAQTTEIDHKQVLLAFKMERPIRAEDVGATAGQVWNQDTPGLAPTPTT